MAAEEAAITIRFNGGSLCLPLSVVPETSALGRIMDTKCECDQDSELVSLDKVVTQEALDHVARLLSGETIGAITEERWLEIANIADFLDIDQLHKAVVSHYTYWLRENPSKLAKYYDGVEGVVDKIDVTLAGRVLNAKIHDRAEVMKFARLQGEWETTIFGGHAQQMTCLAALADGRVASASLDGTVKLWDTRTHQCCGTLKGHRCEVSCLLSLPGDRLASGSQDGTIKIWDTLTCLCVATIMCDAHCMAYIPDGLIAAAMENDLSIEIWNIFTCTRTAFLTGTALVAALALLPDGRLASGYHDGLIRLWDLNTHLCTAVLLGRSPIESLAVVSDGRLASASSGGSIKLWSTVTGECVARMATHPATVNLVALPDGRLASAGCEEHVSFWSTDTNTLHSAAVWGRENLLHTSQSRLVLLPDGRLASMNKSRGIDLLDTTSMVLSGVIHCYPRKVTTIEVMNDGRVAAAYKDGSLCVWNICTGACDAILDTDDDMVTAMVVVPDGRLALGYRSGTVQVLDVHTRTLKRIDTKHNARSCVTAIVVMHNGDLVSCSRHGDIYRWKLLHGEYTRSSRRPVFHNHNLSFLDMVLVPDGHLFALSSGFGMHLFHDTDNGFLELVETRRQPYSHGIQIWLCKPHKNDTIINLINRVEYQLGTSVLGSERCTTHCLRLPDDRRADVIGRHHIKINGQVVVPFDKSNLEKLLATDDCKLVMGGFGVQVSQQLPTRASVFLALTAAGVPATYILEVMSGCSN